MHSDWNVWSKMDMAWNFFVCAYLETLPWNPAYAHAHAHAHGMNAKLDSTVTMCMCHKAQYNTIKVK